VIPLSYVRIVASEMVPTAGVDERGTLVINPAWWAGLKTEEKRFAAIHESLHVYLCHPFRMKGFDHDAYNFAADGKVNHGISTANVSGVDYNHRSIVTLNTVATVTGLRVEDLEKISTEEIVRVLEKYGGKAGSAIEPKKSVGDGEGGDMGYDLIPGTVEGEVIQEGDGSVTEPKSREKLREAWKRLCEKAKAFAKQAGKMPAGLERLVDEVLEVKPPWHVTVHFGLRNSSKFDASFAYPNRRSDNLPSPLNYRYTVWCLIDTSGSISQEELKHFLGIAKHEALHNLSVEAVEILASRLKGKVHLLSSTRGEIDYSAPHSDYESVGTRGRTSSPAARKDFWKEGVQRAGARDQQNHQQQIQALARSLLLLRPKRKFNKRLFRQSLRNRWI